MVKLLSGKSTPLRMRAIQLGSWSRCSCVLQQPRGYGNCWCWPTENINYASSWWQLKLHSSDTQSSVTTQPAGQPRGKREVTHTHALDSKNLRGFHFCCVTAHVGPIWFINKRAMSRLAHVTSGRTAGGPGAVGDRRLLLLPLLNFMLLLMVVFWKNRLWFFIYNLQNNNWFQSSLQTRFGIKRGLTSFLKKCFEYLYFAAYVIL